MLLHLTEETGAVLYCPECSHELWPAYWAEEGLEVGYWSDFAPADGQAGLLVCGNLDCTYEEAVTFVQSPADAVVWNLEDTYMVSSDDVWWGWPQTWLLEYIAEIEHDFTQTGRAKLRSALDLLRAELDEREETVDRWLAEAEKGYPVRFHAEQDKLEGQILASNAEELVLQSSDGQVRVVPRNVVWQEHIEYPRKPRKEPQGDEEIGYLGIGYQFMVVGGYHLAYGDPTELGGYYLARCWDPVAAAALHLREKAPGYWEGTYRADEIDRYYERHNFAKIRGYWLQELGRNDEYRRIWTRTEDPDVAQALDMEPFYGLDGNEFGCWEVDVVGYDASFSLDELEEDRWEEDVQPLPPDR